MSTQLGGTVQVVGQDVFVSSTTQNHALGDKAFTPDGRGFRYVKAGAVALVPGQVIQGPVCITTHANLTPTAVSAVGDTTVTVTLGATNAVTANQYAGGYLCVGGGTTGVGQTLLIASHPAAAASTTLVLTLADAFRTATSGTITMDLIANRFDGVIVTPATVSSPIIGVSCAAIAAGSYGWVQTRGIATVLTGAVTPALGASVGASVNGAVTTNAAAILAIGNMAKLAVTGVYNPVQLNLD